MNVVRDNQERHRYEIEVDGELAGFVQYNLRAGRLILVHTEIDDAFGGRGLGSILAGAALDDARAHGHPVVPLCPFIAAYIDRHPEYADLVDTTLLAAFEQSNPAS